MAEDTMIVNAYVPVPGWIDAGPPDGVPPSGGHIMNPVVTNMGSNRNFQVLSINTDIFDVTARNDSKIDTVTGEIPYDDIISIERGDKRVLVIERNISAALASFAEIATGWTPNKVILIIGNGDRMTFNNRDDMKRFLNNSNRISNETFIRQKEGFSASGYVPKNASNRPDANSGVTIGVGIDLGGKTTASMRNDGVADSFIQFLAPYLGVKGQTAQDLLTRSPLTLTDSQAMDLSKNYINRFSTDIATRYNNASSIKFSTIPLATRTAIVSVGYQYGTNLASATPNFWKQVTQGKWKEAVANLNSFGDNYATRRKSEAALIQSDLNAGKIK